MRNFKYLSNSQLQVVSGGKGFKPSKVWGWIKGKISVSWY